MKELTPNLEVMTVDDIEYFLKQVRENPDSPEAKKRLMMSMKAYVTYQRARMEIEGEW